MVADFTRAKKYQRHEGETTEKTKSPPHTERRRTRGFPGKEHATRRASYFGARVVGVVQGGGGGGRNEKSSHPNKMSPKWRQNRFPEIDGM
jgi:hypothetical protein